MPKLADFAITKKWPAQHPERPQLHSRRLLGVLNQRLADHEWIMGDNDMIAGIASFRWINNLIAFREAGGLVGIAGFAHVKRALVAFAARPAVVRGLTIPTRA